METLTMRKTLPRHRIGRPPKPVKTYRDNCNAAMLDTALRGMSFTLSRVAEDRQTFTREIAYVRSGFVGEFEPRAFDTLVRRAIQGKGLESCRDDQWRIINQDNFHSAIRIPD